MANQLTADRALKLHQDNLFRNPNLNYVAVVEADPSDPGNSSFVLEAGVLDMDKQRRLSNNMRSASEDWSVAVPAKLVLERSALSRKRDSAGETESKIDITVIETPQTKPQSFLSKERPAPIGSSIMNARYSKAGTLGNIVRLPGSNDLFIFSCWHVLCGQAGRLGDPILQPGILDGGSPADIIATLHWYRLTNKVDAALAKVVNPGLVSDAPKCINPMRGIGQAATGMKVRKCGRTTELTHGVVRSINASIRLSGYPGGNVIFENQILTTVMSQGGDSGAMLVDEATNLVVGLIIGGDESTQSCANHMSLVFAPASRSSFGSTRSGRHFK